MATGNLNDGRFVWHELMTSDKKAALAFYSELFGWKTAEMDMGPAGKYTVVKAGDRDVGGIVATEPKANIPPHWLAYCSVSDVDAAVTRAQGAGGRAMVPPTDIPGVGRFAIVADPHGARLAPFRPAGDRPEPEGPPPAGAFCWDELLTSDPPAALEFYRGIYGWTSETVPMGELGNYYLLKRGDHHTGGIAQHPMPDNPAAWLAYVAVDDVDRSARRATSLGGKLIAPPKDVPNVGRFAVVADPTGAAIALFKNASKS